MMVIICLFCLLLSDFLEILGSSALYLIAECSEINSHVVGLVFMLLAIGMIRSFAINLTFLWTYLFVCWSPYDA